MGKFVLLLLFTCNVFAQNKNIDSLKAVLAKTEDPKQRFSILNEILISIDGFQGMEIDSSACVSLLKIAQKEKDDGMLATSYNWIGYYFYSSKGANSTALDYYFKALPLAEKVGDKRRISSICFDIANVYRSLKNYDENYKYTVRGGKNLPDKSSPMYNYMLVQYQRGKFYHFMHNKMMDSAAYYASGLLQTKRGLKSILYDSQVNTFNAMVNAEMGENEIAEIYFHKAKADFAQMDKKSPKAIFYNRYTHFLIDNNRLAAAKIEADDFWGVAKKSENLNHILSAAGLKREIFEKLHQTDSAYFYSRLEATTNDKIFDQDSQNQIQAMAFKEQLRILEEQNRKAEAVVTQKQNLQYIFIAIGILTLIILYLLLSRSFITNTKMIEFFGIIALLIVFEFLNLLLHPFLERITHHNAFLMLLALVCIAALLVPMHHRVERWATRKLIEKNKKIRLAQAKKTIEQLEQPNT